MKRDEVGTFGDAKVTIDLDALIVTIENTESMIHLTLAQAKDVLKDFSVAVKKVEAKAKRERGVSFENSNIYDVNEFARVFAGWDKKKMRYYYDAASLWSKQNNRYIDWESAIRSWALRDEGRGGLRLLMEAQANNDRPNIKDKEYNG